VLDIVRVSACTADSLTWLAAQPGLGQVPVGLYGASTGAAAALMLAAREPTRVQALVALGGRPDMVGTHLRQVYAPTLLIVDDDSPGVLELNRHALRGLPGVHCLQTLCASKNAHHEVDALNTSATLTGNWFQQHLPQTLVH
jgi:pimeloyl-ACP methyl ester carboxylesterase